MTDSIFYGLPESDRERILENDNPYTGGGHQTDVVQIGHSLRRHVKRVFPDGAPERLQVRLDELMQCLEQSEAKIDAFLTLFLLESMAAAA